MAERQASLLDWVAGWGIEGRTRPCPIAAPVPADAWRAFFGAVAKQNLEGLLVGAIGAGDLPATRGQAQRVVRAHASKMTWVLHLEKLLLDTTWLIRRLGVPHLVLKGSALAHLDYPGASLRPFNDIDLLVAAEGIELVRDALLDAGGVRKIPEPRPGFDRWFTKGLCVTMPNRLQVDVHRTLTAGPFGLLVDRDALFADAATVEVGARELSCLSRPHRFVHACYHAMLGTAEPRLVPLRDVVQTAPGADQIDEVVRTVDAWRGTAVVVAAARTASDRLGWTMPDGLRQWVDAYAPDARAERWLARYVGDDRSYAAQAIDCLQVIPGVVPRARYVAAIALPSTSLAAKEDRWRRGMGALSRGRG